MLRRKTRGFSLLESLVALLVISLSLSLFQGMSLFLNRNIQKGISNQEEWVLFCQQFREELLSCELDLVSTDGLYVHDGDKDLLFSLSAKGDFRKTSRDGRGYQPMLFHVKKAVFHQESQSIIWLSITFEDGFERSFFYAFEDKN